jgi:hypothetical protein
LIGRCRRSLRLRRAVRRSTAAVSCGRSHTLPCSGASESHERKQ